MSEVHEQVCLFAYLLLVGVTRRVVVCPTIELCRTENRTEIVTCGERRVKPAFRKRYGFGVGARFVDRSLVVKIWQIICVVDVPC